VAAKANNYLSKQKGQPCQLVPEREDPAG